MEIKVVTTLQELDQNLFPPLPEIPANKHLIISNTPWQNAKKEFAAASLVNVCMVAGQWQPVGAEQIAKYINSNPLIFAHLTRGVANALWAFANEGLVEAVKYQEEFHFIPTPQFAKMALSPPSQLRYI